MCYPSHIEAFVDLRWCCGTVGAARDRVIGLGFRVGAEGLRIKGLGFRMKAEGFRV